LHGLRGALLNDAPAHDAAGRSVNGSN
jgi:hypothetical protein